MNVSKLCSFLERPLNALFISNHQAPDRWLEDPGAVMFVNNSGTLMQIAGNSSSSEPIPWESAREALATALRRHQLGWATMAAFDSKTMALDVGNQYDCHEIQGTQSPIVMLAVALIALASLGILFYQVSR